jgi:hypothetical protein
MSLDKPYINTYSDTAGLVKMVLDAFKLEKEVEQPPIALQRK